MACFMSIFTAAIIFLSSCAWCNLADGWKAEQELNGGADPQHERFARRHPAVFDKKNIYGSHYSAADKSKRGTSFLEGRSLDGPALLASWLGIRQLTCPAQNYFVCANNPSRCCPNGDGCCPANTVSECCPDGQNCCADSEYCVEPNGVCCGTVGTCDAGWNCCEGVACYPNGAECCANGNYCPSGSVCVLYEGAVKCSSTGGVTVAPPTTTAPTITVPATTTTPVVFTYYYFTVTWWYIEWFYIWTIFAEDATTVLTSTTTTLYTTISIYETNSAAAAASFSSISQTLSLSTPAVRTNPVPVGTSPAAPGSTHSSIHSSIPTSTSNVKTGSQTGQSTTSPGGGSGQSSLPESPTSSTSSSSEASTSSPSTSASVVPNSSANALGAGWTSFWAIGALGGMLIAPGFLMVWL